MPVPVRVAVAVLAVLGALLLLNAALSWVGREGLIDRVAAARNLSRDAAERYLLLSLLPYVPIGVLAAVSAWWLSLGRPWARWTGIATAVVLGILTVASMGAAGGATLGSLLVVVLSLAALTSLLARTTAEWAPRRRPVR